MAWEYEGGGEGGANVTNPDTEMMRALISQQEVEARKLENGLMQRKNDKVKALKERLYKKRMAREAELRRFQISDEDAKAVVDAEMEDEEAKAIQEMEGEVSDQMKEFYRKSLDSIRRKGAYISRLLYLPVPRLTK